MPLVIGFCCFDNFSFHATLPKQDVEPGQKYHVLLVKEYGDALEFDHLVVVEDGEVIATYINGEDFNTTTTTEDSVDGYNDPDVDDDYNKDIDALFDDLSEDESLF